MKSSVRTVPWLQHTIISQQLIYGKLHCCSQHNYSLELWKKASLNLSLLMQTFFTTPPDGCFCIDKTCNAVNTTLKLPVKTYFFLKKVLVLLVFTYSRTVF